MSARSRASAAVRIRPTGVAETIELHERLIRTRQFAILGRLKVLKFSLNSIPTENFTDENFYVKTKRPDGSPLDIELDFMKAGIPVATNSTQSELLLTGALEIPPIPDPGFVPPLAIYEKRDAAWAVKYPERAEQMRKAAQAGAERNKVAYIDPIDGAETGEILNKAERKPPLIDQPWWDLVWGSLPIGGGKTALLFQDLRWVLIEIAEGRTLEDKGLRALRMSPDPSSGKFPSFLYVPSRNIREPNRGYIVYGRYEVEALHAGPPTAVERSQQEALAAL